MKTPATKLAAQPTLFDTYAPVERYMQKVTVRAGQAPSPPVRLQPEDAYVMHLFVGMHTQVQAVFDLAAAATWGATTVLWASQERCCRVYTPAHALSLDCATWTAVLRETLNGFGPSSSVEFVPPGPTESDLPDCMIRYDGDRRPVLVVVALPPDAARSPVAALGPIFSAHPNAIVLFVPLGAIGEDARLGELLQWTQQNDLQLAALRELTPFLAASQLAVVFPRQDRELQETLKRIQRLFTGNFDFLTLAHQVYTLSRANANLESQLKESTVKTAELEGGLRECEDLLHDSRMKIGELEQAALGWVKECERVAVHAAAVEHRLYDATRGRGWRLVQRLSALRQILLPRNSLRERCGQSLMRCQRRLRGCVSPVGNG